MSFANSSPSPQSKPSSTGKWLTGVLASVAVGSGLMLLYQRNKLISKLNSKETKEQLMARRKKGTCLASLAWLFSLLHSLMLLPSCLAVFFASFSHASPFVCSEQLIGLAGIPQSCWEVVRSFLSSLRQSWSSLSRFVLFESTQIATFLPLSNLAKTARTCKDLKAAIDNVYRSELFCYCSVLLSLCVFPEPMSFNPAGV
jgi:hypothetical protein